MVIITGTRYAGEVKKSIFSALQYLLPVQGVATMHCSCNEGPSGDSALFFGLSGTGKTTLSTDPDRTLIGDDEHGWSDHGVFNFEGGSYAKVINLSPEAEPDIYAASHRFGTVLENVPLDPETREPLLDDDSVTENMRAAFPLWFIKNATTRGTTGHPSNILMLTADAFGVLPPVAKLTVDQGLYYYLSGYTFRKLSGTETGIDEPEAATFSAGFGLPFMPLDPVRYAELLGERIRAISRSSGSSIPAGSAGHWTGHRIKLDYTRAIVRAIVNGALDGVPTHQEPYFGLAIPPGLPRRSERNPKSEGDLAGQRRLRPPRTPPCRALQSQLRAIRRPHVEDNRRRRPACEVSHFRTTGKRGGRDANARSRSRHVGSCACRSGPRWQRLPRAR